VLIDILTLFPEMFSGVFSYGIMQRAAQQGLVTMRLTNIRDFTHDRHRTVDDYPYGGGAGMVLKPEPVFAAVESIEREPGTPVILLSPRGRVFNQGVARELSGHKHLILICGHYEGVDERVSEHLVSDEISLGDYILTGGELAAMVVVDAVVRLLPGVLGSAESLLDDSHVNGLLEYPQYTRPVVYRGWAVPEVLLSGNHAQIARWRHEQAILRTRQRRPELLGEAGYDEAQKLTEKSR